MCATAILLLAPSAPAAPVAGGRITTLEASLASWDIQLLAGLEPRGDGELTPFVRLEGQEQVLLLEPYSLRATDFAVSIQDDQGRMVRAAIPSPATYRGSVAGRPGSRVAASLIDGRLSAWIELADGELWTVEPLSEYLDGAAPLEHVVYRHADILPTDHHCGTGAAQSLPGRFRLPGQLESSSPFSPGTQLPAPIVQGDEDDKTAEIAFDADYEFYADNGRSVANTVADIENVLNGVEAIYQSDTGICYDLTHIIVRTTSNDPYTSSSPDVLLDQFKDHWKAEQTHIRRDVAHLVTGRNLNGGTIGIAYLSSICKSSFGYGLTERYTSNYTNRVGLMAHELGHNWSAEHCCSGCFGCGGCRIMCPCLGGCSGIVTSFGTDAIAQIITHKDNRGCLDDGCGSALDLAEPTPGLAGQSSVFSVRGATPGGTVGLFYSLTPGSWEILPQCPGTYLGLSNPTLFGTPQADGNGVATWSVLVPGPASGLTVYLQAADASSCALSEVVSYTFP